MERKRGLTQSLSSNNALAHSSGRDLLTQSPSLRHKTSVLAISFQDRHFRQHTRLKPVFFLPFFFLSFLSFQNPTWYYSLETHCDVPQRPMWYSPDPRAVVLGELGAMTHGAEEESLAGRSLRLGRCVPCRSFPGDSWPCNPELDPVAVSTPWLTSSPHSAPCPYTASLQPQQVQDPYRESIWVCELQARTSLLPS